MGTWWISGAASGFGAALTHAVAARGDEVVAVDVDGERLRAEVGGIRGVTTEVVDVRDGDAVACSLARAGDVDVLVPQAGVAAFAPVDVLDDAAWRDLFEVNVFGVARALRAGLAGVRRRRGAVVFVSSVAGRMVFPESGPYAATKHAVEAMAEATFQENDHLGVRVRLVEPGAHDTRFGETASLLSPPRDPGGPHATRTSVWDQRKRELLASGQGAREVARAILISLDVPTGFARVPVGVDADRLLALRDSVSPDAWVELMADRIAPPGRPTHALLRPSEVLAGTGDPTRWRITEAAARTGHLEAWSDDPVGRAALARLGRNPA